MFQIYIISDGSGSTANQMLRAALTQFTETDFEIKKYPEVRSEEQVREIMNEIKTEKKTKKIIVHTVVSAELRRRIAELGRLHGLECIDLMGPLLGRLTYQFSDEPSGRPGLFRKLNRQYFQRIEAIEFALRHDDGLRTHELGEADLVLIGVSRTFKTPLSVYLAFKGWMVGNIPIIADLPLPSNLYGMPEGKVFCLTTTANHLSVLRSVRHAHLGGSTGDYAQVDYVRKELAYAKRIFRKRPDWPIINVTKKPIEEIASEILGHVRHYRSFAKDVGD